MFTKIFLKNNTRKRLFQTLTNNFEIIFKFFDFCKLGNGFTNYIVFSHLMVCTFFHYEMLSLNKQEYNKIFGVIKQ